MAVYIGVQTNYPSAILNLRYKYGTSYDRIYTHRRAIRVEKESKIIRLHSRTTEIIRLDG